MCTFMCTQSTAVCQGLQTGALVPHWCQKGNWNKASLFHQAPNGNKAADACSLQECSTHPSWLLKTPSAVGSLPSKELYIFLLQRVVCLSICLTDWELLALEFQRGHLKLPPHIRTLVHLMQYCEFQPVMTFQRLVPVPFPVLHGDSRIWTWQLLLFATPQENQGIVSHGPQQGSSSSHLMILMAVERLTEII